MIENVAIQSFNEFGWNLSAKEANLVEEVMSFSDILLANYEDRLKAKVRKEIEEEYASSLKQIREENAVKEKQLREENALKEKQLEESAAHEKQLREFYEQKLRDMELKLKNSN